MSDSAPTALNLKQPLSGNWYITPHAIEKYLRIHHNHLTWKAAKAELINHSYTTRYCKEINPQISLYRSPKPRRLRFIVSRRLPGLPQLITILQKICFMNTASKFRFG